MTTSTRSADLRITCLIIEDHAESASMLEVALRSRGIETRTASTADGARSFLDAELPDIIICDLDLPGEDGISFVHWLRGRPTDDGSRIPAIAVTPAAWYEELTSRRARDAGFDLYLAEPLDVDSLPHQVALLVARSRDPR